MRGMSRPLQTEQIPVHHMRAARFRFRTMLSVAISACRSETKFLLLIVARLQDGMNLNI